MSKEEFESTLEYLGLSLPELATLLNMNARSTRRWAEDPTEIPSTAEAAIRAWARLQRYGLAWRPDGIAIGERSPERLAEQIKAYTRHAVDLEALLQRVERRGGPKAPWEVNLKTRQATLGPVIVSFYALTNGGFSPASYTRRDRPPDPAHDWALIEDAFACIAQAVAAAGPNWSGEVASGFIPPADIPSQSAEEVLEEGVRSFRKALDGAKLNESERAAFEAGAQEIAVAIDGEGGEHHANDRFLNLLMSANPNLRPDWPLWVDTRSSQEERFAPKIKNKAWEALIVMAAGSVPWDTAEFFRLDPKGRFYLRRMLDDDTFARANRFPIGNFLDPHYVITRTAEAIVVSLAFAKAMGFKGDDTTLAIYFRWTGLRNRVVHNWTGNGRFVPPRGQYLSSEDEAQGTVQVPLNAAESAIPTFVERATADLFSQFNGFEPPMGFTTRVVQNLLEKR